MNQFTKDSLSILALMTMVMGVGLLSFCLYLIPYAFFGLNYDVPFFIAEAKAYLEVNHNISGYTQMALIMLPPLIAGIILLFITRLFTESANEHAVDERIRDFRFAWFSERQGRPGRIQPYKYHWHPLIKVLSVIVLVLLFITFLEFLLTIEFGGIFLKRPFPRTQRFPYPTR